jgi:predicted extracellular nuclease
VLYGVCFENPQNSGVTITQLQVSFAGEQWRNGGNVTAQSLVLGQQVFSGAPSLTTGTFSLVPSLQFTGPIATATAGFLDGNAGTNRAVVSGTITVNIPAGQRIFLRWEDPNDAGNDHGLAIDDLTVSVGSSAAASLVLSVNSPSVVEGNLGSSNLAFTVNMSGGVAPAGGISFTVQTADVSANAGTDYAAIAGTSYSIAEGQSSTTVNVAIVGDTVPEGNETFQLTISSPSGGATIASGGGTGTGTILNDDIAVTSISAIQGSSTRSAFTGQTVTTSGIVTYVTNNGYFVQTPDGQADANPDTSEGIFVFTGSGGTKPNVGDLVQVTGAIEEFGSTTNPNSSSFDPSRLTITEFGSGSTFSVISSGNALPAPAVLTAADLNPGFVIDDTNDFTKVEALEKYEGMRVQVGDLRVVQSTDFTGVFYAVLSSYAGWPVREAGIPRNQNYPTVPGSLPADAPRFDANQEVIAVDTDGNRGLTAFIAGAGQTLNGPITGVLDYGPHRHMILPDVALTGVTQLLPVRGVRAKTSEEFTIASMNLEQFTNTTARLTKLGNAILGPVGTPDIIGLQEVPNNTNLVALTTQVNTLLGSATPTTGPYISYFGTTTDSSTIRNGYLVNTTRFTPQAGSLSEVLPFDGRAPLVLKGTVTLNGANYPLTVINNHLKSLLGSDFLTDNSDREKRRVQAIALANDVQARIQAGENLVLTGDWNAFLFNDGLVDLINTVAGKPAPCTQVLICIPDVWSHTLLYPEELYLPTAERYTYLFRGDRQALDHVLASPSVQPRLSDYQVAHLNAEYPPSLKNDETSAARYSDHDHPVLYLKFPAASSVNVSVSSSAATFNRSTQVFTATLTLRNNGAQAITDTVFLVLKDLPASVTVTNAAGTHQGAPYLMTNNDIAANGGTTTVVLQYRNTSNVSVTYTPQVIVGSLN